MFQLALCKNSAATIIYQRRYSALSEHRVPFLGCKKELTEAKKKTAHNRYFFFFIEKWSFTYFFVMKIF